VINRLKDPHSK